MSLETFDVNQMLGQLVANVRPLLQKNANLLTSYCSDGLGPMTADGIDIRQVILSVLRNACTFTRQGSITIDVEGCTVGTVSCVRFSVTDTGIGMTEELKTRALKPLTPAELSAARRESKTGLSIPVVARLCQEMGGSLSVRSRPGEGSCFTLVVPIEAAALAAGSTEETRVA